MSTPGLDDWLGAVGFVPIDEPADADDPWRDLEIEITPLTDAQRAHLIGDAAGDLGPLTTVDPALLAEAEATVIDIPDDPDDVEPF